MMRALFLTFVTILAAAEAIGQSLFQPGEMLISGLELSTTDTVVAIYSADGTFRRELLHSADPQTLYRDPIVRGPDEVLIPNSFEIHRVNASGVITGRFARVPFLNFATQAADGRIVASNGSGQVYVLDRDGNVVRFRDTLAEATILGVDLAPDQCTTYFESSGRIGRWNACADDPPVLFGPLRPPNLGDIRLLRDGTYLVSYRTNVDRVDASGNPLRSYGVPGGALGLDLDGTSFWTAAGRSLVKVDIETGAILRSVDTPYVITWLEIVGEPRAAVTGLPQVPALSTATLILLICGLIAIGVRVIQ